MNEEIESMTRYDVFEAVDESAAKGQQILTCKWVMKRKINSQGRVYRYRARLVAQGFRQIAGNSYDPDTISSPVVSKDSLRMSLACQLVWICEFGSSMLLLRFCRASSKTLFSYERLLVLKGMSSPVRF